MYSIQDVLPKFWQFKEWYWMFTAVYGYWNAFESDVCSMSLGQPADQTMCFFKGWGTQEPQCSAVTGGWCLYCARVPLQWWMGNFMLCCLSPSQSLPQHLNLNNHTGVIAAQKPGCLGRSWKAQKSQKMQMLFLSFFLYSHRDSKHYLCTIMFATLKESQIKSFLSCSRWEATWFMTAISLYHMHLHANIHLPEPWLIFRMMFTRNKHTSRSFIYL